MAFSQRSLSKAGQMSPITRKALFTLFKSSGATLIFEVGGRKKHRFYRTKNRLGRVGKDSTSKKQNQGNVLGKPYARRLSDVQDWWNN